MMRVRDAPINSAALTKSSSRNANSLERTARAKPGQSNRPKMIVIAKKIRIGLQLTGRAAESASHNGNSGSERRISIVRDTLASTQPPR